MLRLAHPKKKKNYNVKLTYFLRSLPPTMTMGENFNCVLTNTDCHGTINFSKALYTVAHSFGVVDVWENVPPRAVRAHCTSHGATRLDRIYVTSNRSCQMLGVETVVVTFTSPSGMSAS
jgi:hypothetical protein